MKTVPKTVSNPGVFTPKQLDDWASYEAVRAAGLHNMFSGKALSDSGLSRAEYSFVMTNYTALRAASAAHGHMR